MKIKKLIFLLLSLIIIFGICLFIYISFTIPDIENFSYDPEIKSTVYSMDNYLIADIYDENRTLVRIEEVPQDLVDAIISIEDERFYEHDGFDLWGIIRAFFSNWASGEITQGGSTITQQISKLLFLTDEQSYIRKIKEVMIAVKLEEKFSKEEILEIYLNEIYLGEGTYGVEEASWRFFDKSVKDTTLAESALLAALPQAPSVYSPVTEEGFEKAKARQEIVLENMLDNEFITKEEYDSALNEEIEINTNAVKTGFSGTTRKYCASFTNMVLSEAEDILTQIYIEEYELEEEEARSRSSNDINEGGFKITSTLNYELQQVGVNQIEGTLNRYGIEDKATLSFVSIEDTSGRVVAYYGGSTQIDMANTPRQPGSTIKPLYVSKLFETGKANPYTLVSDERVNMYGYSPGNYGNIYAEEPVSVRLALIRSYNQVHVRLFDRLGVTEGVDGVKDFGITSIVDEDYNYAFSLGGLTHGISPLEMASAYTVFGNEGKQYPYYFVEKIEDSNGKIIYEKEPEEAREVLSESSNNQIVSCLEDVVRYGTGSPARNEYLTIGKTGTTSDKKDFWFCGVTGNVATSVWIGDPGNDIISYGASSWSARFYGDYLTAAINKGLLNEDSLEKAKEVVELDVYILKDSVIDTEKDYYTEEDIEKITIAEEEMTEYAKKIVYPAIVDKTSNKLFNEGKCSDRNKEERYYFLEDLPREECNKFHFFGF